MLCCSAMRCIVFACLLACLLAYLLACLLAFLHMSDISITSWNVLHAVKMKMLIHTDVPALGSTSACRKCFDVVLLNDSLLL